MVVVNTHNQYIGRVDRFTLQNSLTLKSVLLFSFIVPLMVTSNGQGFLVINDYKTHL